MSSQIPFTPVTPEALGRLTPIEQQTFAMAAELLAAGQKPSMMTIVALVEMVQRLITEPSAGDGAKLAEIEALCSSAMISVPDGIAQFGVVAGDRILAILGGSGAESREQVTAEAVAAERERIRQLAIRCNAVSTADEGTQCWFADLIGEPGDG